SVSKLRKRPQMCSCNSLSFLRNGSFSSTSFPCRLPPNDWPDLREEIVTPSVFVPTLSRTKGVYLSKTGTLNRAPKGLDEDFPLACLLARNPGALGSLGCPY